MRVVSQEYKLERGSSNAAGYDLKAIESGSISPLSRSIIRTGIRVEIPVGYYGRVAPRSGLAVKNGINVLAGVIDSDYRGEIMVVLHNTDQHHSYHYEKGDRIAQLIIETCHHLVIEYVDSLESTERGKDGFGSTGK